MPELPEVETTKNAILPFSGKTLKRIIVNNPSLRWPIDEKLINKIKDVKILSISRRAKYIFLHLEEITIIIHLGMTGTFRIQKLGSNQIRKHDHVIFEFRDKTLVFNDPRRFGSLHVTKSLENHFLIKNLGPEPLEDVFNAEYLYKKIKKAGVSTKSFLMNQKNVVGIGNIYACEILFSSGISPKRKIKYLNRSQCEEVVKNTKRIIKEAITKGGTTLKDFYSADGNKGYFKIELNVYDRENEECRVCNEKILRFIQNQRSTFYCKSCQN
jgi:formamidopyrimidine-DNA glycosylase